MATWSPLCRMVAQSPVIAKNKTKIWINAAVINVKDKIRATAFHRSTNSGNIAVNAAKIIPPPSVRRGNAVICCTASGKSGRITPTTRTVLLRSTAPMVMIHASGVIRGLGKEMLPISSINIFSSSVKVFRKKGFLLLVSFRPWKPSTRKKRETYINHLPVFPKFMLI